MIRHALDFANFSFVAGWACSKRGVVTVTAETAGREPVVMTPGMARADAARALGLPDEHPIGYVFFPFQVWPGAVGRLPVRLTLDDGREQISMETVLFAPAQDTGPIAHAATPFPADVVPLMLEAEPGLAAVKTWNLTDMEAGVEALRFLIDHGDRLSPPLVRYRRYLETMRSVSRFALANMLPFNTNSRMGQKDFWTLGTDLGEHMSLTHYLYCLKSHGIEGDVAEFGCFKGLSSSILSAACSYFGVRLHVHDSFGGLPASNSPYYAASEFRGSLDEVRGNIARYGDLGVCDFHPGFFSESMAARPRTPLCMVWVDVDLESSALDMTSVFDDLSPRGGVVSNEAHDFDYDNGKIVQPPHPDAVLPVLRDALEARFGVVRGDHLANCSGSLYAAQTGLPVLPWAQIRRLLADA